MVLLFLLDILFAFLSDFVVVVVVVDKILIFSLAVVVVAAALLDMCNFSFSQLENKKAPPNVQF